MDEVLSIISLLVVAFVIVPWIGITVISFIQALLDDKNKFDR